MSFIISLLLIIAAGVIGFRAGKEVGYEQGLIDGETREKALRASRVREALHSSMTRLGKVLEREVPLIISREMDEYNKNQ